MHLLILGSSARAAAASALRAGIQPWTADLFADQDLRQMASVLRVDRSVYPGALAPAAARAPDAPWMYTGALENHPDLVASIAGQRMLWGNDAAVLRAVRDPFLVAETLRAHGLCAPAIRRRAAGLPGDGSWLVKPFASGGGHGIVPLRPGHRDAPGPSSYLQKRVEGPSLGAVFVANCGGGDSRGLSGSRGKRSTTLAGVTRQWIGSPGVPFAYAGSVGPWPLAERIRARIEEVGQTLASAFGLIGLFGVDLILCDGEPWTVEVNPRYTASVEVLELATGRSLLAEHARACDPAAAARIELGTRAAVPGPAVVGKLVVFAPRRCRFPDRVAYSPAYVDPFSIPDLADIPDPGTVFEPGDPVLTVLADGPSVAGCRLRLKRRRAEWLRRLGASA